MSLTMLSVSVNAMEQALNLLAGDDLDQCNGCIID